MNPESGDGRNYWGPLIVGGAVIMAGAHGLAIQHVKAESRQSEIREKSTQSILRVFRPEPNDRHTHQDEYSPEPIRGHFIGINTSGDAQFIVRQNVLSGKSPIEVEGKKFSIRVV